MVWVVVKAHEPCGEWSALPQELFDYFESENYCVAVLFEMLRQYLNRKSIEKKSIQAVKLHIIYRAN